MTDGPHPQTVHEPSDADLAVDAAIATVDRWLRDAPDHETARSRATMEQLRGIVVDPAGLAFVMRYVDRVARPDDHAAAARQMRAMVRDLDVMPAFLSPVDRLLLRAGARLAPLAPGLVMPIAGRRMRSIVGHLIAPAEPRARRRHLEQQRSDGVRANVNLLGEAVLGDREAARRMADLTELIADPGVDHVSTKPSAIVAQLDPWDRVGSLGRVVAALGEVVDRAAASTPPTLVNVDMEEYHDLHLTLDAFKLVLDAPERLAVRAGIVVQAYLPDAVEILDDLAAWAGERVRDGGAPIEIRLVKGANLAMELVHAEMHGWQSAPYGTKAETDANFVRCLDRMLRPDALAGVRLGIASHNLFHMAWAHLVASERGVRDLIRFEMLQGMAEAEVRAASADLDGAIPPRLYTPAVRAEDFDVAIAYLFRRLDENASPQNFMRALLDLDPDSPVFDREAARFRASVLDRDRPAIGSRRTQDRLAELRAPAMLRAFEPGEPFRNEPDTDPDLPANATFLERINIVEPRDAPLSTGDVEDAAIAVAAARSARIDWWARPAAERRDVLHRVGDELARRRDVFMRTMAVEADKVPAQADGELAEAIDFARYYAERTMELEPAGLRFEPFGLVTVVPPWNFPVAIPAGGVLASLAAGNAVAFKPAPATRACAALVHDSLLAAGVPADLVPFFAVDDGAVSRHLVETADAVILTGSTETADLFRSWRPEQPLFAETSGKNALIITPHADMDLAVADLVASAFGHAGQKCSAASLAILVGGVERSQRFRRQLVDAVEGLVTGPADRPGVAIAPLVGGVNERLHRAFTELDDGESWLVEPTPDPNDPSGRLWRPGVREGVRPGSWFHRTECFGPVLGLIAVDTLDQAIRVQNDTAFGLTAGIHTLDDDEIAAWTERVEAGNAYVNRVITGAIVQRQPFGGWKRSSVGPGAKAGGPNYVAQLGTWSEDGPTSTPAAAGLERLWAEEFAVEHDPAGLRSESNVFRYRPLARLVVRHGGAEATTALAWYRRAADVAGVELIESDANDESEAAFADRLGGLGVERVRCLGVTPSAELWRAAADLHVFVSTAPVVFDARRTLLELVREQSVSRTLHRFGNLPPERR